MNDPVTRIIVCEGEQRYVNCANVGGRIIVVRNAYFGRLGNVNF